MKFFKPELWAKINSEIDREREEAELEWDRNDKTYWESFKITKQYLPEQFLSVYLNNHGFHDCLISGMEITKKSNDFGGSISIDIKISKGSQIWLVRYGHVTKLYLDFVAEDELSFFPGTNNNVWDEWGYDEFSYVGEDMLSHEILFSSGRTILIYFRKISVENLSKN